MPKKPEHISTDVLADHYTGEYAGLSVTSASLGALALYGAEQANHDVLAVGGTVAAAGLFVCAGITLKKSLDYLSRANDIRQQEAR